MPAIQKSAMRTRKQEKAQRDREATKARRVCTDAVWLRAGNGEVGRCERTWFRGGDVVACGAVVYRAHSFFMLVGHVDEIIPRSQGGDPTDPANCRLVCYSCHFSGPSGAHRKTER